MAADESQCLATDVVDAFSSVEKSLRKWAVEGPPGNQRGSAQALADRLGEAISKIQGLTSESAIFHEERTANSEKLVAFEKEVACLKASLAELKSQKDNQEANFKIDVSEQVAAFERQSGEEKASTLAKIAQLQALLAERDGMLREDSAAVSQVAKLQAERSELRIKAEATTAELAKLRQRETTLAAQVASVLAPVSVMCRTRPLVSYHEHATLRSALLVDGGEITVEGNGQLPKRKFLVDRVLEQSQEDVFGSVAPWVENVMGGGSSCIMSYGATGSGKTYTLLGSNGPRGCPGIAHHALKRLIDGNNGVEVKISMVEVYCDQIRDLLAHPASSDGSSGPPILSCSRRDARGHVVLDCAEERVHEYSKAEDILRLGFSNRTSDATLCNDQSSRSHVVLTLEVLGQAAGSTGGRLVLIDLAGSENIQKSGADECGKLLAEAKAINKSLSALADVVEAVAKRQNFVPYRNSRLTMLLEETLSVAKVCLLVHVSPLGGDVNNTCHSLQFAGRIRAIDFGAQQLRKDQEERLRADTQRNKQENTKLQAQLEEQKKETTLSAQAQQELKQQIARLSEQLREKQRDLTRESELRSKLEASTRATRSAATAGGLSEPGPFVPKRPSSPLMRQPNGQAARRIGAQLPRKLPEAAPEEPKVVSVDGGNATRIPFQVLADLTNCEDRLVTEGKLKERLGTDGKLKEIPEAECKTNEVTPALPKPIAALETPTKAPTEVEIDLADVEVEVKDWVADDSEPVAAVPAHPASASVPVPVKGVLRKVPTNFTEQSQQRSSSCPHFGIRSDPRIKWSETLQEASSPPKWYLEYLEADMFDKSGGRSAAKVKPSQQIREISPRRKREAPVVVAPIKPKDADGPKWR